MPMDMKRTRQLCTYQDSGCSWGAVVLFICQSSVPGVTREAASDSRPLGERTVLDRPLLGS